MAGRVLQVLAQRPGRTGSGTTLDALVRAAADAGWDQHVVVGVPSGEPLEPLDMGGLAREHVHPLEFGTAELPFPVPGMSDVMPYESSRFGALTASELERYRSAWRAHLERVIAHVRPDVVHAHHLWIVASLVRELASDARTLAHCHGTGLRQMELCPELVPTIVEGLRGHAGFFALHAAQRAAIVRALAVDAARVHVVGAGFRDDLFRRTDAERGPRVLYAGKLSRAKGVAELVEAFRTLRARDPAVELHVAGAGAGDEARELTLALRATDGVTVHGALPPERLARLMRTARVFVLPSYYEGLPLVLVEAAASGCRLVATDLDGVRDGLRPALDDVLTSVAPPALATIDRPEPEALPAFVERLASALEVALATPPPGPVDLEPFTWRAVFRRIERHWNGSAREHDPR